MVGLAAAITLAGCSTFGGLRGDEAEVKRAVRDKVPAGTPIEAATATMTEAGYRCGSVAGKPEVLCSATSPTGYADWRVTFTVVDGVVTGARVVTWATFL